jgi:hypothetical protein
MTSPIPSEWLWRYWEDDLSPEQKRQLEEAVVHDAQLQQEWQACGSLLQCLKAYEDQPVPRWTPEPRVVPQRSGLQGFWWGLAAGSALGLASVVTIWLNLAPVSRDQLEQRLAQWQKQQTLLLDSRLADFALEQDVRSRELLESYVQLTEEQRQSDLSEIASWMAGQQLSINETPPTERWNKTPEPSESNRGNPAHQQSGQGDKP